MMNKILYVLILMLSFSSFSQNLNIQQKIENAKNKLKKNIETISDPIVVKSSTIPPPIQQPIVNSYSQPSNIVDVSRTYVKPYTRSSSNKDVLIVAILVKFQVLFLDNS